MSDKVGKEFFGILGLQDRDGINNIIKDTCILAGRPNDYKKLTWRFNSRLKTTMGYADYQTNTIDFCYRLWGRASYLDRRQVIIHETCHLICFYKYNADMGHNQIWKNMMVRCNAEPERYHNVNVDGMRNKYNKKLYEVRCECSIYTVDSHQLYYMKKNNNRCVMCKSEIDSSSANKRVDI